MRTRARADLALELGVGEVGVALHVPGLEAVLGVNDDPGAGREGDPFVGAQVRRDARIERLGLDLGEQAELSRGRQAGGVDGDQDVGWAVGPLIFQALEEFFLLAFDAVDADAGFLGEAGVERLVGLVVAGGIEVEDLLLGVGAGGCERQGEGG